MSRPIVPGMPSRIAIHCVAAACLAASSAVAHAQGCSTEDDQIRAQYQQASLQALLSGDLTRFASLQESLPGRLSTSCRARLNQLEPMRVKCTAQEKSRVMEGYRAVFAAAQSGNVMRMFDVLEGLEATVSSQCWLAANRQSDPRALSACTASELDHLASFAGPTLRASRILLSTFDPMPLLRLNQQMVAPLSQSCQAALARVQQAAQMAQPQPRSYRPPSVLDHGGGTYSVPGMGACTPSGCVTY